MQKGSDSKLVFDKHGQIFAIATGADNCAEHECGSKPLMEALCAVNPSSDEDIVTQIRSGNKVQYPALIERKHIARNLDKLIFATSVEGGEQVAVFGYARLGEHVIKTEHHELSSWRNEEVVGAWDEESFAIKVRGTKLVKKLHDFAVKVQGGNGVFAGTFLANQGKERLSGVIIALQTTLRPEHKQAILHAQAKWESEMRLKARSRTGELQQLARDKKAYPRAEYPGYIWPVWKDNVVDGEVRYALNPGYGVKAQYWGPYTFEQLRDWIIAEKKYELAPIKEAA